MGGVRRSERYYDVGGLDNDIRRLECRMIWQREIEMTKSQVETPQRLAEAGAEQTNGEMRRGKKKVTESVTHVKVRYPECDPMNIVHHSVYPVWMEMARTDMLRKMGVTYKELEERNEYFAVAKLDVRYLKPAMYDDELEVHCRIKPTAGVKIEHEYEIVRDGELLVRGKTTVVCLNKEGKLQALPDFLRDE